MSTIAQNLEALQQAKEDIAEAITEMGGTVNEGDGFSSFAADIATIPTGGGGSGGGTDVVFYDYDGTVVQSYSTADFLALSNMPENPSHAGLVAQGWNWTLSDAKTFVTKYGKLNIGQYYETESGLNEADIYLTPLTGLVVTFDVDGTKDWGDGTTDSTNSHTYDTYGKYTIKTSYNFNREYAFGRYANSRHAVTNVRLKNGYTSIGSNVFYSCYNLQTITMPNTISSIGANAFYYCRSLRSIVTSYNIDNYAFRYCYALSSVCFPKGNGYGSILTGAFDGCRSLKSIIIPSGGTLNTQMFSNCTALTEAILADGVRSANTYMFSGCSALKKVTLDWNTDSLLPSYMFNSCYSLEEITKIPATVTDVGQYAIIGAYNLKSIVMPPNLSRIQDQAFADMYSCLLFDFSNATQVPTLTNTNAFNNMSFIAKIVVPDALYDDWIIASNWVSLVNYIYKASEVNL